MLILLLQASLFLMVSATSRQSEINFANFYCMHVAECFFSLAFEQDTWGRYIRRPRWANEVLEHRHSWKGTVQLQQLSSFFGLFNWRVYGTLPHRLVHASQPSWLMFKNWSGFLSSVDSFFMFSNFLNGIGWERFYWWIYYRKFRIRSKPV